MAGKSRRANGVFAQASRAREGHCTQIMSYVRQCLTGMRQGYDKKPYPFLRFSHRITSTPRAGAGSLSAVYPSGPPVLFPVGGGNHY